MTDYMPIKLIVDPPKDVRPEGAIRADVAWKLFMPEDMGDIPAEWKKNQESFKHWLWVELSRRLGFLHESPETVYILTPRLTEAGKDFLVRTCSFWSNQVFALSGKEGKFDLEQEGENLWIRPVLNVHGIPGDNPVLKKIATTHHKSFHSLLSPLLGSTRSNIREYVIPPGSTFARFHSHTAREELYMVLAGKGSARIAGHRVDISEGDLISKPLGPDIPTQLLADKGIDLRILDFEIWPDAEKNSKDLVHYPDHGELDLFGEGWNLMLPSEAIIGVEDSMKNYDTGYVRHRDGSWEPKQVEGFKKRER